MRARVAARNIRWRYLRACQRGSTQAGPAQLSSRTSLVLPTTSPHTSSNLVSSSSFLDFTPALSLQNPARRLSITYTALQKSPTHSLTLLSFTPLDHKRAPAFFPRLAHLDLLLSDGLLVLLDKPTTLHRLFRLPLEHIQAAASRQPGIPVKF